MFSKQHAQHAMDFIQALKHGGNWRGSSFDLLKWQNTLVKDVFGTVKANGYRQYVTSYLEIPKKNGKTELAAGVGLYLTCGDGEQGAEVYGVATDRQQASIAFDVAVEMVDQCPALKKRIKLTLSQKHMLYLPTHSIYKVFSGETKGKHGYKIHGVIFDELHEQTNRELYDILTFGSGASRMQPLYFLITTAGDDPDRKSIAWGVHQKALRVMENPDVDPTFYPVIYGIDEDADPADEKNWKKANPSLGETITIDAVRREWTAVQTDPVLERKFRQLRLNQWLRTKSGAKWVALPDWDATSGHVPTLEKLKGRDCFGGLDLSSKIDLTSFVLLFPPTAEDPKWHVIAYFWLPEDNLKDRIKRDNVPYDRWAAGGFMKLTPGNVVDYNFIKKAIIDAQKEVNIVEIGFDPWNAQQVATDLGEEGFTMVEIRQGAKSMSGPMKELQALILQKLLQHGGNPVLRWNLGNLDIKADENENIRPVKGKSTGRIDGIVAMINAMARASVYQEEPSVYESRGVLTF